MATWMRALPLVLQALEAPLGPWRYLFLFSLVLRRAGYLARFTDPADDEGLREYKRKLVWVVMIHDALRTRLSEREATRVATDITRTIAVHLQQSLYRPIGAPSLDGLVQLHRKHRAQGPFRHIEYADVTIAPNRYDYRVTRCRFHEAFSAMGAPALTRAFCESDELVFNGYAPGLRFDRAGRGTIARGAPDCTFHFEQRGPSQEEPRADEGP